MTVKDFFECSVRGEISVVVDSWVFAFLIKGHSLPLSNHFALFARNKGTVFSIKESTHTNHRSAVFTDLSKLSLYKPFCVSSLNNRDTVLSIIHRWLQCHVVQKQLNKWCLAFLSLSVAVSQINDTQLIKLNTFWSSVPGQSLRMRKLLTTLACWVSEWLKVWVSLLNWKLEGTLSMKPVSIMHYNTLWTYMTYYNT